MRLPLTMCVRWRDARFRWGRDVLRDQQLPRQRRGQRPEREEPQVRPHRRLLSRWQDDHHLLRRLRLVR